MEPEKPKPPDDELELAPVVPPAPRSHIRLSPVTIQGDVACIHCGYNLKMQPRNGRCPECGKSVQSSFSDATFIQLSIKWAWLEIAGAVMTAIGFAALSLGLVTLLMRFTLVSDFLLTYSYLFIGVGSITIAAPEPGRGKSPATAILLGIASLAVMGAYAAAMFEIHLPPWSILLAGAAHFFFLGLHLTMQSERFYEPALAKRFMLLGLIGAISAGMLGLLTLSQDFLCLLFLLFILIGVMNVLSTFFFGYWSYLLVRFAMVMRQAIRMARQQKETPA
jgi:hypothetical protein